MDSLKIITLIDDEKIIPFSDIKNWRSAPTGYKDKLVEYWVESKYGKVIHGIAKEVKIVR